MLFNTYFSVFVRRRLCISDRQLAKVNKNANKIGGFLCIFREFSINLEVNWRMKWKKYELDEIESISLAFQLVLLPENTAIEKIDHFL